jgi:hypothetical protein
LQQKAALFDHLVGADKRAGRDSNAERPGGLEVQEQLNFRGLLYRQLARLFAFENTGDVDAGQTVSVGNATAIARQAASRDEPTADVDRLPRGGVPVQQAVLAER